MTESLASRLQEARRAKGLTQQQIANALGVSRAAVGQWEGGVTEPSVRNMKALNDLLSLTPSSLPDHAKELLASGWRSISSQHSDPSNNLDIPVTLVASANNALCFNLIIDNEGVLDHVYRPRPLRDRTDIYAVMITTSAFFPRYEYEDIIYVSSSERPVSGDYSIIMLGEFGGRKDVPFLRRIAELTSSHVIVETFQPAIKVELPLTLVTNMHRVLPWNEILNLRLQPLDIRPRPHE